jgi:phosphatidylserine decarboxylase
MMSPFGILERAYFELSRSKVGSRLFGHFADIPLPRPVLERMIRLYVRVFQVDMGEAVIPAEGFDTFDRFFTRRLKDGARVFVQGKDVVASPCDGRIQAVGEVDRGMLFQAKSRNYRLEELLCDPSVGARFEGGRFVTIYLSPRDYHRVHFPCDGNVTGCRHVPGRLYTVSPRAAARVPRLFARNERMTTLIEGDQGAAAVVLVGAVGVGRISLAYHGMTTNRGQRHGQATFEPPVPFVKGDDLGAFHLGSTVILILEGRSWEYLGPANGEPVRAGSALFRKSR